MTLEQKYILSVPLEHRKKYAQFFTPERIATFMCQWVMKGKHKKRILEPAYGLGVFSRQLKKYGDVSVDAYEIDSRIFSNASSACPSGVSLWNIDYFSSDWNCKYDAIVCNPPYLKFHDYDNSKYIADVNSHMGTKLNGFTNLYTLFLLKSLAQLEKGGRLAYIVPSEFLNSDYGVEVKRALIQSNSLQHIIVVDFTESAFDDALTTACILLCERNEEPNSVKFSLVKGIDQLYSSLNRYTEYNIDELDANIKWKSYYEGSNCEKYRNLVPFSTFAKVSRGIATGANNYFTFRLSKIDEYNIPDKCFRRCICHAVDVQNQIFTNEDFEAISQRDKTVYLFNACEDTTEEHVASYIRLGEEKGVDKRYLTSSRNPWYALEKREPAPIWVSVFNRNGLRFIRNKAGVYNLTTFHCVYNVSSIDTDILFAYLVTDVAKEIFLDNSRQYGNGLVKFEPNDLNQGMVVDLRLLTKEEKNFISKVSERLQYYGAVYNQTVDILNDFFREKFTSEPYELSSYQSRLNAINVECAENKTIGKTMRIKQINFLNLFDQYSDNPIVENSMVHEDIDIEYETSQTHCQLPIDSSKNALICNVKKDNWKQYLEGTAKIYYTGKKFPTSVALNKLYYFIPYMSGKGIRDLYYIKIARLGYRKEGQVNEDKHDLRLVFEIERIGQLFDDYKMVKLEIWRTFTDTSIKTIMENTTKTYQKISKK